MLVASFVLLVVGLVAAPGVVQVVNGQPEYLAACLLVAVVGTLISFVVPNPPRWLVERPAATLIILLATVGVASQVMPRTFAAVAWLLAR